MNILITFKNGNMTEFKGAKLRFPVLHPAWVEIKSVVGEMFYLNRDDIVSIHEKPEPPSPKKDF